MSNDKLLTLIDSLYWNKAGASPHEYYRRERVRAKLVKRAKALGLIEE